MKLILIFLIQGYQRFISKRLGRTCLFEESCSNHVLRITKKHGFSDGLKALRVRYQNCKPGYHLLKEHDCMVLITCTGIVIPSEDINIKLINSMNQIQPQLNG